MRGFFKILINFIMKRIIKGFITISLGVFIMIGIIIPAFNLGKLETIIATVVIIAVVGIIVEEIFKLNKSSKKK